MDRMANRNQGAEEELPSPMLKPNLMAAAAAVRGGRVHLLSRLLETNTPERVIAHSNPCEKRCV
jgi:hypothetical protein